MKDNKFSFDTIKDFDTHIELSIPNYRHLNEIISDMASYFIKPNTSVYDIGCSTGQLLGRLYAGNNINDVEYVGYDISDNLLGASGFHNIHLYKGDLLNPVETPISEASLVLSIFTLQFLPPSQRWEVVKRIASGINKGGAFIVAEKVYLKEGFMQELFTFTYYDYKKKSFTEKEIMDKQRDLRAIMSPFTEAQNLLMFREAGFQMVECFFTSLLFKAWVCLK